MPRVLHVVGPWAAPVLQAYSLVACSSGDSGPLAQQEVAALTIQVSSSAFTEGAPIRARYTCDGDNVSPPLKWTGVPEGARSLALIADDPDAPGGTWVHWVLYGLPPDASELPEDVSKTAGLPSGARQGVSDFGRTGYGGPCPPRGGPHRYYFKLYALDAEVQVGAGATKSGLLDAMEGH